MDVSLVVVVHELGEVVIAQQDTVEAAGFVERVKGLNSQCRCLQGHFTLVNTTYLEEGLFPASHLGSADFVRDGHTRRSPPQPRTAFVERDFGSLQNKLLLNWTGLGSDGFDLYAEPLVEFGVEIGFGDGGAAGEGDVAARLKAPQRPVRPPVEPRLRTHTLAQHAQVRVLLQSSHPLTRLCRRMWEQTLCARLSKDQVPGTQLGPK